MTPLYTGVKNNELQGIFVERGWIPEAYKDLTVNRVNQG